MRRGRTSPQLVVVRQAEREDLFDEGRHELDLEACAVLLLLSLVRARDGVPGSREDEGAFSSDVARESPHGSSARNEEGSVNEREVTLGPGDRTHLFCGEKSSMRS